MNTELLINGALAIIGTALIAAGVVGLIRSRKTGTRVWSGIAIAVGLVMWLIVLLTTAVTRSVGG